MPLLRTLTGRPRDHPFFSLILFVCGIFLALLSPILAAPEPLSPDLGEDFDQILINSQDWRDVYQGYLFARLSGYPVDAVPSSDAAKAVVDSLSKEQPRVLLLQPSRRQLSPGLPSILRDEGFTVVTVDGTGSMGLRLCRALPVKGIIVMDERYPANAVSLGPYALQRQSCVLFADATTIDETVSLIAEKDVPVTTYGILDETTTTALAAFSPTVIDEGGKFDNNLYIVKEFFKLSPGKQVILTNGEFLEESLIMPENPILFIGRTNVPKQVETYLATSSVASAVLVGNYLASAATQLKRTLETEYDKEIFVVAKIGRSPRVQETQFSTPVSLEYFPLPINLPNITISGMAYNRLSKQLEVTYENPAVITAFFLGSFTLTDATGTSIVGDEESQPLPSGQQKTILYAVELQGERLSADALVLYGEEADALENSYEASFTDIPIIDIKDNAELLIESVVYDVSDESFVVTLENPGTVTTYATVELRDVIVDGLPSTLGARRTVKMEPQGTAEVYVRASLSKADMAENEDVHVVSYYGQRETVLLKKAEATLPLHLKTFDGKTFLIGAAVLILLLLLLSFFRRKKTYACDRCGHRIASRRAPGRHSCGGRFRKE
jgi:hypothetical protein